MRSPPPFRPRYESRRPSYQAGLIASSENDTRSPGRQAQCNSSANTAARAGHNRKLAFQRLRHYSIVHEPCARPLCGKNLTLPAAASDSRRVMRFSALLSLTLLLSACSETPTETKRKSPRSRPLRSRHSRLSATLIPRPGPGRAIPCPCASAASISRTYRQSPAKQRRGRSSTYSACSTARQIYTWSATEASETLHKGVFAGKTQSWSSSGQEKPFEASDFHIDSPAALETATANSKAYLDKPGTKPASQFFVEFTPRFPEPVGA